MLGDLFLGSMIRSALYAGGKPHLRAASFLTGGMPRLGLGLNLGTMLGAAGLAWGAYEHFKDRTPGVMTTVEGGGFPDSSFPPPGPQPASPPPPIPSRPPPIPGSGAGAGVRATRDADAATAAISTSTGPDALRRLVALTIAAARADGELGEEEYGRILADAREHDAEKLVGEELANPRTIQEIVVGAMDPAFRRQLYTLAYGIVRADAGVSAGERKWLRELALALDFDSEATARLEQETAGKIDRQIA